MFIGIYTKKDYVLNKTLLFTNSFFYIYKYIKERYNINNFEKYGKYPKIECDYSYYMKEEIYLLHNDENQGIAFFDLIVTIYFIFDGCDTMVKSLNECHMIVKTINSFFFFSNFQNHQQSFSILKKYFIIK